MKQSSKQVSILGIDLAKRVFAVHGIDTIGAVVLKRTVSRAELPELVAKLPPCLIGMESCSGAHEWARRFQQFGHTVRLIAPAFVAPYRKSGKNDANDAEAICEAVGRPTMRFVPIKSVEQQAILTLHRARQGYVEERTALINRIRGLMSEFGQVFATRQASLRSALAEAIECLPVLARQSADGPVRAPALFERSSQQLRSTPRGNRQSKRQRQTPDDDSRNWAYYGDCLDGQCR